MQRCILVGSISVVCSGYLLSEGESSDRLYGGSLGKKVDCRGGVRALCGVLLTILSSVLSIRWNSWLVEGQEVSTRLTGGVQCSEVMFWGFVPPRRRLWSAARIGQRWTHIFSDERLSRRNIWSHDFGAQLGAFMFGMHLVYRSIG
jgi:hypothetical protein